MIVPPAKIAEATAITVAESFTTAQTARILGVSEATVRRRRLEQKLYGFPFGRQWRYSVWQFGAGSALPGIETVVKAIPPSMHPAFVRGMMLAPRPRLADSEEWESPRTFLIGGGDPARVAAIFETRASL
ncbi:hypothetical protein HD599_003244 [Conyzicola lurida]|uniref:Helix-turn-helix domain-containing protein n=1 Tax=Conyzicola lurida TaxID=1172621 RepID=A0A841ASZ6_9MICO|nr:helix-turn-helix domain-containing protein [Conyzicola lurida]MBB5844921.1 hypothetical protein [Conyzicola lurida]